MIAWAEIMTWLGRWALRALLCLAALGGAWWHGYTFKARRCELDAQRAQAQQLAAEHAQYMASVARGAEAAKGLLTQLDEMQSKADQLNARLKHVPFTVSTPRCADAGSAHLSVAGRLRWNAALATSGVPEGASGADAAAAAASASVSDAQLASDSGVALSDANDNREVNFQRFAQCYARLTALQKLLHVEQ